MARRFRAGDFIGGTSSLVKGGSVRAFRVEGTPERVTIKIDYLTVEKGGYFSVYLNGRDAGRVLVTPDSCSSEFTLDLTRGVFWVVPDGDNGSMGLAGASSPE